MSTYIETLTKPSGDQVAPRTVASAVTMTNGTTVETAVNNKIDTSTKGSASGVASLDVNAKVPLSQINDALLGNVQYQTTWNASTNSPTLPAVPTTKGQYWITSVAGTQFGISFEIGDWIIAGDSAWQKVDNTDAVSSVAGRTGNVVLTKTDVGLGNVDNTSDLNKPISTATQTALNAKLDSSLELSSSDVNTIWAEVYSQ